MILLLDICLCYKSIYEFFFNHSEDFEWGLWLGLLPILTSPPTLSPLICPFTFFSSILRVKHHNILQLVDAFETKKEYFIFLELWVLLEEVDRKGWQLSSARQLFSCYPHATRSSFRCSLCPELQAERCSTGSWTKGTTLRGTPAMSWGKCWRP